MKKNEIISKDVPASASNHEIVDVVLAEIMPYWRNPRKNDAAVEHVIKSIERFGFNVPLILDGNNVIIAGHTRYRAAQKLKLKKVPCIVLKDITDKEARKFRIADNKTAEFAKWDSDKLTQELISLQTLDAVKDIFSGPDWEKVLTARDGDDFSEDAKTLKSVVVKRGKNDTRSAVDNKDGSTDVSVPCPHCGQDNYVRVKDGKVTKADKVPLIESSKQPEASSSRVRSRAGTIPARKRAGVQ